MRMLHLLPALLVALCSAAQTEMTEAELLKLLTGGKQRAWTQVGVTLSLGDECTAGDCRYIFQLNEQQCTKETCIKGRMTRSAPIKFSMYRDEKNVLQGVAFDGKDWAVRKLSVDAPKCDGHEDCLQLIHTDRRTGAAEVLYLFL